MVDVVEFGEGVAEDVVKLGGLRVRHNIQYIKVIESVIFEILVLRTKHLRYLLLFRVFEYFGSAFA